MESRKIVLMDLLARTDFWTQWGRERVGWIGEYHGNMKITIGKIDSRWEFALWDRELSPELRDHLGMGGGMGGGFRREGTYVYLWLIHVDVWQKPTQYYKTTILQVKKKRERERVEDNSPNFVILLIEQLWRKCWLFLRIPQRAWVWLPLAVTFQ